MCVGPSRGEGFGRWHGFCSPWLRNPCHLEFSPPARPTGARPPPSPHQPNTCGPTAEVRQTEAMRITYLGHASVLIELDGLKVITDPLLRPRDPRRPEAGRAAGRGRASGRHRPDPALPRPSRPFLNTQAFVGSGELEEQATQLLLAPAPALTASHLIGAQRTGFEPSSGQRDMGEELGNDQHAVGNNEQR